MNYKRILIIRTDRIGDVLLSTPAVKAVRDSFPDSHIAMMVRPYALDIVEGNPYLNEVILYDKYGQHKGWSASMNFAFWLKSKKFDLVVILHPTTRVNVISFFARIPKRVGYNRKFGFLLTDKLKDNKHLGKKHELEYSLDVIRSLGLSVKDKDLCMPKNESSDTYIDELLIKNMIFQTDKIIAIHPGASCVSKIWPADRFAYIADRLIEKYGLKVIIVAASKDKHIARKVLEGMKNDCLDFSGLTTVSQLGSLLKRCNLFVSNDSGPVHIASAVRTPTLSIFGRNQPGLSPTRWRPLGKRDRFLHKDVGCKACFAHNCKLDFKCLKSIAADEVLSMIDEILNL